MTGGDVNLATFQNAKEILVTTAGRYLITWSVSFNGDGGGGLEVEGRIGVNDSAQSPGSSHRKLSAANDLGSMCGVAVLDLAASARVSIMVQNNTNTVNIIVNHASLALVMVGGT